MPADDPWYRAGRALAARWFDEDLASHTAAADAVADGIAAWIPASSPPLSQTIGELRERIRQFQETQARPAVLVPRRTGQTNVNSMMRLYRRIYPSAPLMVHDDADGVEARMRFWADLRMEQPAYSGVFNIDLERDE